MRSTKTVAVVALVLAGWSVSGGTASAEPEPPPPGPSPAPAQAEAPAPEPAEPKTTIESNGTYVVGTDIVPGTYTSAGPLEEDGACYWKRSGSLHGDEMLENAMSKKPQVVHIEPTDKTFTTSDCQPWQQTDPNTPATNPAPGAPQLNGQALEVLNGLNDYAARAGGAPMPLLPLLMPPP